MDLFETLGNALAPKKTHTKNCINCNIEMKIDINPFYLNEQGENTAKKTFYGGWVCSESCEKENDLRMRKEAESSIKQF